MCNLLQHQYLKVFSNPSLSNRLDDANSFFMMDNSNIEIPLLDSIKVSSQDVKDAIASMNKFSAKTAAVVPIHKGGSKSDPANYRPVSLTSVIMKIFERIMRKA